MWTGIDILYGIQEFRLANPFLEQLAVACSSRVMYLVLPILIVFLFYWCINKRQGEILGVGYISTIVFSMNVKFGIAMPRPWDLDPRIIEVQGVHADGLSCPSGHSAIVTNAFGTAACFSKHLIFKILLVLLIVIVISARLILCVHTPLDIIVGVAIGIASAIAAWKLVDYSYTSEKAFWIVTAVYVVFFTAMFIVAYCCWGADIPSLIEYMGFFYGVFIGRALEHVYVKYEIPELSWKKHAKRYLVGVLTSGAILAVFLALDPVYGVLAGGLIMTTWAFAGYPMLMKKWKFLN